MFKQSFKHKQREIFDWDFSLPNQSKLSKSIWHTLRSEVFEKVNESAFRVLFPSHTGRPNSPINEIVTLLVIKELYDWSFRELEDQMYWNIGVMYACGVAIGESTVSLRTLSNFIQYLREYQDQTGIDLFNLEFNRLIHGQIESFKLNTKIARTDSTQIATNVVAYNRLQLVIESIKRLHRVVSEMDQQYISMLCEDYIKYDADNYVSLLTSEDIKVEFPKAGACILSIIEQFKDKYADKPEWQMFIRIFGEQYDVDTDNDDRPKANMKSSDDKSSSDVRAIDDPEATLRSKSGVNHLGYVGNVIETSDPEADLNLICDVTLCPNNTADGEMLRDSIDDLVSQRLTELEELHFDGGYGGPILDDKLRKHSINCVQTGIRGVKCDASMHLEDINGTYYITCAEKQRIACARSTKGYRATFDQSKCESCSKFSKCPAKRLKSGNYVYYLKDNEIAKRLRLSYINTIPKSRRSLRSGVEATIRQFKCRTKAGKTRLRGLYRHKLWFTMLALAINIKRIFNYTITVSPKCIARQLSRLSHAFLVLLRHFWAFQMAFRRSLQHYSAVSGMFTGHTSLTMQDLGF
jgi:hypothetical protein